MRKSLLFVVTFLLISIKSIQALSTDPKEFVNELINEVITKLSDKSLTDNDKKEFIEKIASENVDINALGLYTLGEIRKTTNKEKILKLSLIHI